MEVSELFSRRNFFAAAGGTFAAAMAASSASADGASHTLWALNPDWGTPLTTATGSDTKTRCHASACHSAAPHRFFFSSADAIAGRLHVGCLAQPVPVSVCVDLNVMMPYYNAAFGGIDGRCPALPVALRDALYGATPCAADTLGPPTTALPQQDGDLPVSGADTDSILAIAAAATGVGVVAWAATSRDAPVKN